MREWDELQVFPKDKLKKAADLGFGAMYCKQEFGGTELNRVDAR